ncbi:MAG: hypothetical protein HY717_21205 [Planctomycetes bacterium]|nr:hypothetical protein [Planctomycetota bacterium]
MSRLLGTLGAALMSGLAFSSCAGPSRKPAELQDAGAGHPAGPSASPILGPASRGWRAIWEDHKNFYSPYNLENMLLGMALAAPVANTSADRDLREQYQLHLRSSATDGAADVFERAGDYFIALPVFAGATLAGAAAKDTYAGSVLFDWGQRSLRSMAVGVPPLLFWQRALGASRPNEDDSRWHPFQDNNAVSGHSFVGAIPFLTAASMTDAWHWRCLLVTASLAPGWARFNNDDHYFSQAALGWWLAALSVFAVDHSERSGIPLSLEPMVLPQGGGFSLVFRF